MGLATGAFWCRCYPESVTKTGRCSPHYKPFQETQISSPDRQRRLPTRRRLRFTGKKKAHVHRRSPGRGEPPAKRAAPTAAAAAGALSPARGAAATRTPTPIHPPRSPQNASGSPPKPPIIRPATNKVYLFEPPRGLLPIVGREAWEDEYTTCKYWDRPPRTNHLDTPTYPWMPTNFKVSFKLGFKP